MTDMAFSTPQLAWTIVLILVSALIKSGFGIGAGVFLAATLCMVVPPKIAIALGGPVMFLTNLFPAIQHRKAIDGSLLGAIVAGSLVGIALGAQVMHRIPEPWFARLVGMFCLAFAGRQALRMLRRRGTDQRPPKADLRRSLPTEVVLGVFGGIATVISHSSGLVYSAYLMRRHLGKDVFVGTVVAIFTLTDFVKCLAYWQLGLLTPPILAVVLWSVPAMAAGSLLGAAIHRKVSAGLFQKAIVAVVLALSVRLVFFA